MNQFTNPSLQSAAVDAGLRSFLMGTYRKMTMAMIVSMVVAWAFGNFVLINEPMNPASGLSSIGQILYRPSTALILTIGIFVAFGGVGSRLMTMSQGAVNVFLYTFAAVMGVWLSAIAIFVNPLISAKIFFMAAAAFAGVSIFGYITKRDLGPIAKVAFMVFIGVVSIFFLGAFVPSMAPSGGLELALNIGGLVAVSILAAWKTQELKTMYFHSVGNADLAAKYSSYGAAALLLSFINIFTFLMNIFGGE